MTLNGVMAAILHHSSTAVAFGANYVKLTEADPQCRRQKCSRKILVFDIMRFMTSDARCFSNFSRKLTHLIFLLFELCHTARPSQQQLSSCLRKLFIVHVSCSHLDFLGV